MSTAPRLGLHRILLVILCPFVLPGLAQAQNPNTSVPATVLDANNQPLIGAVVVVKDPVTNTGTVSAPTDGQGKTVVSTGNIPQGGVLFKWYLCPGKPPTIFAVRPNDRRPCQDAEFIGLAPLQPGLTTSIVITPTSIIASTGDNSFIASIGSDVTAFANGKEVPNPIGTEPTAAQAIPPPPPGTTSIPFTVTDVNNQPLPGATVVVKDPVSNTGTVSAPTDDQGKTIVSTGNVPAGGVLFTWYLCPGPPPKIFAVRPNQPRPCQDAEFIGLVPLQPGLTQSVLIGPTAVLTSTGPDTFIVSVGTDITAFVNGKEVRSPIVAGPLAHPQPMPASQETPAAPPPAPGTYTKPPSYPPLTAKCPECKQFADKYNLYAAFLNDDYLKKTNLQKSMDITRQAIADREKQIAGLQQQSGASSDPAIRQQINDLQQINAQQEQSLQKDASDLQMYDQRIASDTKKLKDAEATLNACECPEPTKTAELPAPAPPTETPAKPDQKEQAQSGAGDSNQGFSLENLKQGAGAEFGASPSANPPPATEFKAKESAAKQHAGPFGCRLAAGDGGIVARCQGNQKRVIQFTFTAFDPKSPETIAEGPFTFNAFLPPLPGTFRITPMGTPGALNPGIQINDVSVANAANPDAKTYVRMRMGNDASPLTPPASPNEQQGLDDLALFVPSIDALANLYAQQFAGQAGARTSQYLVTPYISGTSVLGSERKTLLRAGYSRFAFHLAYTPEVLAGSALQSNLSPQSPSTPEVFQFIFFQPASGVPSATNPAIVSPDGKTFSFDLSSLGPAPNSITGISGLPKDNNFFNTGNLSHELKYGAAYRVAYSDCSPSYGANVYYEPVLSFDPLSGKFAITPIVPVQFSAGPNGITIKPQGTLYLSTVGSPPPGASIKLNFDNPPVGPVQLEQVDPANPNPAPISGTRIGGNSFEFKPRFDLNRKTSFESHLFRFTDSGVNASATTGLTLPTVQVTPTGPGVILNPILFTSLLVPSQRVAVNPTVDPSGNQPTVATVPTPANPPAPKAEPTPPAHHVAEDITPKPEANPRPYLQLRFNSVQITNVTTSSTSEPRTEAETFDYSKLQFNYSVKPTKKGKQPQAVESIVADLAQQSPSDERGPEASLHRPLPDQQGLHNRANPYLQQAAFHSGIAPQAVAPGTLVRLVPRSRSSSQASPQVGVPISFSFIANGNASGEAFELRVVDPSGKLQEIRAPDGLILEPLERGSVKPVSAGPGERLVSRKLNAYCVKYDEDPPEPDAVYRVAAPEIQEQYKPIRAVMRAGRELAAAGKFHPDSDATAYNIAIRQYAIWTKLENWSEQKFGEVFLEKTRKIAADSKVEWNKQMDQALRALIPGRWRDISLVLEEARKLDAASQAAGAPPAPAH